MKIVAKSSELTIKDVYTMTKSPSIRRARDCQGARVGVAAWLLYDDERTDNNGEVKSTRVLSIMDKDGDCMATNSSTFIRSFFECVAMCDEYGVPLSEIFVREGTSKNGRTYIDCEMAF